MPYRTFVKPQNMARISDTCPCTQAKQHMGQCLGLVLRIEVCTPFCAYCKRVFPEQPCAMFVEDQWPVAWLTRMYRKQKDVIYFGSAAPLQGQN